MFGSRRTNLWGDNYDAPKHMKIETPQGWRKGQTIFNFLWFLKEKGMKSEMVGMVGSQDKYADTRMADPFHLPDELLEKYYQEFLEKHK